MRPGQVSQLDIRPPQIATCLPRSPTWERGNFCQPGIKWTPRLVCKTTAIWWCPRFLAASVLHKSKDRGSDVSRSTWRESTIPSSVMHPHRMIVAISEGKAGQKYEETDPKRNLISPLCPFREHHVTREQRIDEVVVGRTTGFGRPVPYLDNTLYTADDPLTGLWQICYAAQQGPSVGLRLEAS